MEALPLELVGNLPRHILYAAGTRDEALDHKGDAQGELLVWKMGESIGPGRFRRTQ